MALASPRPVHELNAAETHGYQTHGYQTDQHRTHHYRASCSWEGSTGLGYDGYDRSHRAVIVPASSASAGTGGSRLDLTSDPAFGGRADQCNPEQLLLLAASSCQLLSFLAVAARARLDVVAYSDDAEAVMPEDDPPVRITEIRLRPRITVRTPATEHRVPEQQVIEQRIRHLTEVAHRECFIANSLRCRMTIEATVIIVAAA